MKKLERNDPCHCGSGKKYKKCCLEADEETSLSVPEFMSKSDDFEDDFIIESLLSSPLLENKIDGFEYADVPEKG